MNLAIARSTLEKAGVTFAPGLGADETPEYQLTQLLRHIDFWSALAS
jgi:hypothetical protein